MTSSSFTRLGQALRSSLPLRLVFAVASGALLAFSFADFDLIVFAFIGLAPLICSSVTARGRLEAVLLGAAASATTWLVNVPWVITVMSKYGGLPYATGVTIYVAMAIYLSVFGSLFALLVFSLRLDRSFRSWLLVPLSWAVSEYARTWIFTGFPWNLSASAIVDVVPLIQLSRWVGPYVIAALLAVPSTLLAWTLVVAAERRKQLEAAGLVALLLVGWTLTGFGILGAGDSSREKVTYRAAMIQPNISQEMRWSSSSLEDIFGRMTAMTRTASSRHVDVILWPESTVPLTFETTDFYRQYIEGLSRSERVDVILGSIAEAPEDPARIWNAAYLVSGGTTVGHYDKMRLVPYGEYVPLRKFLFFARKLVRAVGQFQFGTNDHPLVGRFHYGPAICYEVVFPSVPATQVRNGADVLVTITNDAWFGDSSAPRQHLNSARLRAVETDRWMLRAGTTGISAIVDPRGRITTSLSLNREGIVVGRFAPRRTMTPYVRGGDILAILSCLVLAVALLIRMKKGRLT